MSMHVLTFRVGQVRAGFPLSAVREVLPAMAVTPVAAAHPGLIGVIDLRGRSVPVCCMHVALLAERVALRPQQRFVIAAVGDRTAAFVVDAVEDLVDSGLDMLDDSAVGASPALGSMVRDSHGPFLVVDPADCLAMLLSGTGARCAELSAPSEAGRA